MTDANKHDNITLFELPDFELKDINVDFNMDGVDWPDLNIDLNIDDIDLNFDDFDLHVEDIDLDLNFDDIMSDKDFDLPVLDFSEIPGLELYEGGTK